MPYPSALGARSKDDRFSVGNPALNAGDVAAAHRRQDEPTCNFARGVEEARVRSGGGENDVDGSRERLRFYSGGRRRHLTPEYQLALVENAERAEAGTLERVEQVGVGL